MPKIKNRRLQMELENTKEIADSKANKNLAVAESFDERVNALIKTALDDYTKKVLQDSLSKYVKTEDFDKRIVDVNSNINQQFDLLSDPINSLSNNLSSNTELINKTRESSRLTFINAAVALFDLTDIINSFSNALDILKKYSVVGSDDLPLFNKTLADIDLYLQRFRDDSSKVMPDLVKKS